MAFQMRQRYIPVDRILSIVSPKREDTILDIGAGDGFYAEKFAEHGSKVIAIDVNTESAVGIKKMAETKGLPIEVINADVCKSFNPPIFNKVFFSTSFHDIDCRINLLNRIREMGKKPTEVTLIEFKKIDSPGPPLSIRIDQRELDEIFIGAGFRLAENVELEIHYVSRYIYE